MEKIHRRSQRATSLGGGACTLAVTLNQEPTDPWKLLFRRSTDSFDANARVIFTGGQSMTITGVKVDTIEDEIRMIDRHIERTNMDLEKAIAAAARHKEESTKDLAALNERLKAI